MSGPLGHARLSRRFVGAVVGLVVVAACGGPKRVSVRVPPRVDITQYGRVGLANFTIQNAKGQLQQIATQRFSEELLAAQQVEVLELGSVDSVLKRTGDVQFTAASAQTFASRDVPAVFAGHLKVSNVKPAGKVLGLNLPRIEATVQVDLTVGLFSTKTGGTLWRASATATEKVGGLGLVGGEPYFTAKDPNDAYGRLVNILIIEATRDFRETYRIERR